MTSPLRAIVASHEYPWPNTRAERDGLHTVERAVRDRFAPYQRNLDGRAKSFVAESRQKVAEADKLAAELESLTRRVQNGTVSDDDLAVATTDSIYAHLYVNDHDSDAARFQSFVDRTVGQR